MKLKSTTPKEIDTYKRRHRVNIRLSQVDLEAIQKMANEYTDGNISEFIRYAAVNFQPKARDLTE